MVLRFNRMAVLTAVALVLCTGAATGQSIFRPLPARTIGHLAVVADSVVVVPPAALTQNAWRFLANLSSFAVPENALLTGSGISYQHLRWNGKKWRVVWSVGGMSWYKASLNGDRNSFACGLVVGFFNNLLLVGIARGGGRTFGTVGPGVNLNN